MKIIKLLIPLLICFLSLTAQDFKHYDYIGAGHSNGITVTTSSSTNTTTGTKTVDGFPIQNQKQLKDASRFLAQCTFGADFSTIEMTAAMGYEAWLEEQFSLPHIGLLNEMYEHSLLDGEEDFDEDVVNAIFLRTAWGNNNLMTPDLLRQRINFNLSQIFVINTNSDLFEDFGQISGTYYDMLGARAFDNYENLLLDVSLSPAMGIFLSHYNNPKADPVNNIHPDENYAREIMQLFSIGLWELNQNGIRKYDTNGNFIPTYTNADIKEFAQVFTGLSGGSEENEFGGEITHESGVLSPMKMFETYHDKSEKHLLKGYILPAGQDGMTDIRMTVEHLANHNNTAPFISKSLIKMLTTSNPSPTYVQDVATVFNPSAPNNFKEVIKAILLHPEARTCNVTEHYSFGKLREPMVRIMNLLKAFPITPNDAENYMMFLECFFTNTAQAPLKSPSVFNFYSPFYQPQGSIGQNYLFAPEFQILNAPNTIGIINEINHKAVWREYLYEYCLEYIDEYEEDEIEYDYEGDREYIIDYSRLLSLVNDSDAFLNHLDILLANGLLSDDTKNIIKNAIDQLETTTEKVKMAIYLILISPDYVILR